MSDHVSEIIAVRGAYGEMPCTYPPLSLDSEVNSELSAHDDRTMTELMRDLNISAQGSKCSETWPRWYVDESFDRDSLEFESSMKDLTLESEIRVADQAPRNRTGAPSPELPAFRPAEWYIQTGVPYRPPMDSESSTQETSQEIVCTISQGREPLRSNYIEDLPVCDHGYCEHAYVAGGPTSNPDTTLDCEGYERAWQGKASAAWSPPTLMKRTGPSNLGQGGCLEQERDQAQMGQQDGVEAWDEMDLA